MKETYDIAAAVEAQKEYCKEYAARHPEYWMAKSMSYGEGFAPVDGRCWCCRQKMQDITMHIGGARPKRSIHH